MILPVVALGLLLTLVVAVTGLSVYWAGRRQMLDLEQRAARDEAETNTRPLSVRLESRLRRTRLGHYLQRRLDKAGNPMTLGNWALLLTAVAMTSVVVAGQIVSPLFAVVLAAAAVRACFAYLDRRLEQRRELFVAQLPEMARVLSNAASAGLALRTAIGMAANDLDEPAAGELRRVSDQLAVGMSLDEALLQLEERVPSRELSVLVRTLVIQARAGGAVVTALRGMSDTLDARKDLRREVRTMLAGSVFTSYAVLVIGVGSLFLLNFIIPGALQKLTHELTGQITLVVSVGMFLVGYTLIRRATRII